MAKGKKALVTGAAGFIGSSLIDELLNEGWSVTGLDNFDPFYEPAIKWSNVDLHLGNDNYRLVVGDIRDYNFLKTKLTGDYDVIVHLAAKAGVRPSILSPFEYTEVNVNGTQNLLELTRLWNVKQFVFASSSSVYGINPNVPWKETDNVLMPISPYANTKVSAELLGSVYSHLYNIRFLALRFFTVFGPRQRPDLAIHKFSKMIMNNERIPVFGDGSTRRDYTYVQDVVSGIKAAMLYDKSLFEVINLGNNRTVTLLEMIGILEDAFEKKARIDWLPEQAGDVPQTFADLGKAKALLNYNPQTRFEEGIYKFKEWLFPLITTV